MNVALLPFVLTVFAGFCKVVGRLLFLSIKEIKETGLSFLMGLSAGAMVVVAFMELLPDAVKVLGYFPAVLSFFVGILFIGLIDIFVPHHIESFCSKRKLPSNYLKSGLMIAVAMIIHNFPEGIAVFMSSVGNIRLGILIAITTALHNIPEGIAISMPVYLATKSRRKTIEVSFLAGIAEPLGALLAFTILQPFISAQLLACVFAFVAGIMVYISFDELMPSCFEKNHGHTAINGIVVGMMIMAISLGF